MANEKKFYSFLNVTDGPDGTKNCTTVVTLIRPELKQIDDEKKVLQCSAALTNRDKALSQALGCEITPTGETVWVDVTFWNALADRFQKFIGDRDKVRVVLCGRISVRKWKGEDGKENQKIQISANDWIIFPSTSKKEEESAEGEELY